MRLVRTRLLVLVALLPVLACRGREGSRETLTIAVRADVTGLFPNPPMTNDSFTLDVNANVFEGLVALDAQLVPRPALAERWQNPDPLTWVFHLRPGVRFSDGRPLSSRDVVASLTVAKERKWCNEGALQSLESVRAEGDGVVRIRTRVPFPNLLSRLHYGFVLPSTTVTATPVVAIGTGPFQVERWEPGRELVLARNPRWRGPPPDFGRIRFEVVTDHGERVRRVLDGRARIAEAPSLSALAALEKEDAVRVLVASGLRVIYLAPKVDEPPFDDPRVREALDLALDREELIKRVLYGRALPATQLVTPQVAGFDQTLRASTPDRDRARRLLAAAGHANGLSIRLDGPERRYTEDVALLHEVARQLLEVGIHVEVNALPKQDWINLVTSGKSRLFLYGWACETRDAGDALDALVHSPGNGLGANNYQGIADPELDRLIDAVGQAPGSAARNELFARALARVDEQHLIVPLEVQPETMVLSHRISWEPPLNFGFRMLDRIAVEKGR